jgi:FtsP/CotA-like multicopper oxidase with cupredoxin domain
VIDVTATGQIVTNAGRWMAHHIAEHDESEMMFSFNVTPAV